MKTRTLAKSFKRMIHILSTGKNFSVTYGSQSLFRAEVHVLEEISRVPGINANEIAHSLHVTKGAVSQIIKKLRGKDLISRKEKASNSQRKELFLSVEGKVVIQGHYEKEALLISSIQEYLDGLSEEHMRKVVNIVNKVSDHLLEK